MWMGLIQSVVGLSRTKSLIFLQVWGNSYLTAFMLRQLVFLRETHTHTQNKRAFLGDAVRGKTCHCISQVSMSLSCWGADTPLQAAYFYWFLTWKPETSPTSDSNCLLPLPFHTAVPDRQFVGLSAKWKCETSCLKSSKKASLNVLK